MSGYLRWNMRGKKPSIFPSQCNFMCALAWILHSFSWETTLNIQVQGHVPYWRWERQEKKSYRVHCSKKKRFRTKQGRHSFCHQYKVFILIRWNQCCYRKKVAWKWHFKTLSWWLKFKGLKRLLWIFWLNGKRWSILEPN